MADKRCPRCGLWNSASASRCDCGYDFEKGTLEESYNKTEIAQAASRDAQNALITAIVGIFVFGIILEPGAIYLARKAKKSLAPGEDGYNNAKNAEVIGWVGFVLWIFVCIFQAIVIVSNSVNT
jgi:hypothetical protein